MAEKTILVDGKPLHLRATAAVPRLYRIKFGRDVLKDIIQLRKAFLEIMGQSDNSEDLTEEQAQQFFSNNDLEVFENIAYIMAKHGDSTIPNAPEEWLENFETLSIYAVLPEILSLWMQNEQTAIESKKKLGAVAGN